MKLRRLFRLWPGQRKLYRIPRYPHYCCRPRPRPTQPWSSQDIRAMEDASRNRPVTETEN